MIVVVLVLLAVALTWVLFRDDDSAGKVGNPVSGQEQSEREGEQRADE